MTTPSGAGVLRAVSEELADAVARVAPSVVRVDDGSRLTASGIVWTPDGVIVTSSHGVERDEDLSVELASGSRHAATLVGRDPDTDLAVLRVSATGLTAVVHANPDGVRVGALAIAVGRPGDGGTQATIGIVVARLDTEREGQAGYILHTDAALYPGFSGGALVDAGGQLLGLANRAFGRRRGVAVGTPVLEQVAAAILAHGGVRRGYLGIRTQPVVLPEAARERLGRQQERALLLLHVEANSPAEQAGLLLGDALVDIEGRPVQDADDLREQLRHLPPGRAIWLGIVRGGESREITATLGTAA